VQKRGNHWDKPKWRFVGNVNVASSAAASRLRSI
jgi:hypothetical protein